MSLQSLAVTLVVSSGPVMGPHRMRLAIHLSGVILPAGTRAGGTVARPDRGLLDLDLDADAFHRFCRAAEEAGFAERAPRVEAKIDTSDTSTSLLLQVAHERGSWTLDLLLMASGFKGPDASPLHRFFAVLLECAGVRDETLRRDLAGLD